MLKIWKIQKGCLKIPVETGAEEVPVRIYTEQSVLFEGKVPLSRQRVDFWARIPVSVPEKTNLTVEMKEEKDGWRDGIRWEEEALADFRKPVLHAVPPSGSFHDISRISKRKGIYRAEYVYDPFGRDRSRRASMQEFSFDASLKLIKNKEEFFVGDIEEQFLSEDGLLCAAKSAGFQWENCAYFNMCTPFLHISEKNGMRSLSCGEEIERLRIWKREWENLSCDTEFSALLRFRIKPGIWPNIELLPPEGKEDDVTAKAFEIHLDLIPRTNEEIIFEICGIQAFYNHIRGSLSVGQYKIPADKQRLCLTCCVDAGCAEFICGDRALFYLARTMKDSYRQVDNSVSGNLEKCELKERSIPMMRIICKEGTCDIRRLEIYGLQKKENTEIYLKRFGIDRDKDSVFYKCKEFTVYHHRVWDENYGYPEAVIINDRMVVSPTRIVEEFDWRKTPWGDMNRIVNRDAVWHGNAELDSYPQLTSPVTGLNAAYNLALNVIRQCKSKKYALNGQKGLWSAGLFQGAGESFGVWLRDSVHVLMRCGGLIDPAGAGKTLCFAMKKGFDNGADGPAMGAVGVWEYYLLTGNQELLYEMWPILLSNIREADKRYDEEKKLVFAEQSTSNDAFPEPENGGYSLSTESYFMKAYEATAAIAKVIGFSEKETIKKWRRRGQDLRQSIREQYWNSDYGYFTSGPKGSVAFEKGFWETSGEESVIWRKFHIASEKQRSSILERLEDTAMTAYGIKLFPYRKEKNHFCGSVWGVWQAGFASAASASGDVVLVKKLLAQQMRACLINKTFYEVIDADTGKAWRWPGQLWNSAGFISLIIYGVFGLEYTEAGMYFHPAVPEDLRNISLTGLPFWGMILNIRVCGWGACLNDMKLDGKSRRYVDHCLSGAHDVVLYLSQDERTSKKVKD